MQTRMAVHHEERLGTSTTWSMRCCGRTTKHPLRLHAEILGCSARCRDFEAPYRRTLSTGPLELGSKTMTGGSARSARPGDAGEPSWATTAPPVV